MEITPASLSDLETMSFEQAMAELETLVRQLEEGRYNLEEAIIAYERGSALKTHCEAKLKNAKLRVEQIMVADNEVIGVQAFTTDSEK